jgi:hypothetical protein
MGVNRADWLPRFLQAANQYAATPAGERHAAKIIAEVYEGVGLVFLLKTQDAAEALRTVATTPEANLNVRYACLVALRELGTQRQYLLSLVDYQDATVSWLAVLVIGTEDDPAIQARITELRQATERHEKLTAALDTLAFVKHNIERYSMLSTPEERVAFVEHWLQRAYSPRGGIELWCPYSGGHPLSFWSFERWRELARNFPQEMAVYIANIDDFPSPKLAANYRQFLADLANDAVREELTHLEGEE